MPTINTTLYELTLDVESEINKEIVDCYAHHFDENEITVNLLKLLRKKLKDVKLTDLSTPSKFLCEAYKLKGTLEKTYGDIAVIIKIHYQDNSKLEGVGFLEAKRIYPASGEFDAFKICQIERLYSNAPKLFVLTYDNKCVGAVSKDIDIPLRYNCNACFPGTFHNYASIIPGDIVLRDGKLNKNSYKNGIPFSYQLCYRYFQGFDLHFSRSIYESVEAYAVSLRPQHIMAIDIIKGDQLTDNIQRIQVDTELYSALTDSDNNLNQQ